MINISAVFQEKLLFLHKFFHAPKQIGSIAPSSKYLAQSMISRLPWDQIESVAELGAGTGAITHHICKAAKPGTHILLFEKDSKLNHQLTTKFPDCACFSEACKMKHALQQENIEQLDVVFSGLPFFNFPQELRTEILEQVCATLKPNGTFIAFQYSLQMKAQFKHYFDIQEIRFVPLNLPPAFVYVCHKKG